MLFGFHSRLCGLVVGLLCGTSIAMFLTHLYLCSEVQPTPPSPTKHSPTPHSTTKAQSSPAHQIHSCLLNLAMHASPNTNSAPDQSWPKPYQTDPVYAKNTPQGVPKWKCQLLNKQVFGSVVLSKCEWTLPTYTWL